MSSKRLALADRERESADGTGCSVFGRLETDKTEAEVDVISCLLSETAVTVEEVCRTTGDMVPLLIIGVLNGELLNGDILAGVVLSPTPDILFESSLVSPL